MEGNAPSWHKCRRFWRIGVPCAFRGIEHFDDGEEQVQPAKLLKPAAEPQIGLEVPRITQHHQDVKKPRIDIDEARKVYQNQAHTVWTRTHEIYKPTTVIKPARLSEKSVQEAMKSQWPTMTGFTGVSPGSTSTGASGATSERSIGRSSLTPGVPKPVSNVPSQPILNAAYLDGMGMLETLFVEQLSRTVSEVSQPQRTYQFDEEQNLLAMSQSYSDEMFRASEEVFDNDIPLLTILKVIVAAVASSVSIRAIRANLMAKVIPIRPGVVPGQAGGLARPAAPAGGGGGNARSIVDELTGTIGARRNEPNTRQRSRFRRITGRIAHKAGQISERPRGGRGRSVSRRRI